MPLGASSSRWCRSRQSNRLGREDGRVILRSLDRPQRFQCDEQDGASLSTNLPTSRMKRPSALRAMASCHRQETGDEPGARSRGARIGQTLGVIVLATLLGLTSWVVASISTWLVPVYVTAIVLIFVLPEPEGSRSVVAAGEGVKPASGSDDTSAASGFQSNGPVAPAPVSVEKSDAPGASSPGIDVSSPEPVKPRRSRSRPRKAAKPEADQTPGSTPTAWIRVGPGKFVRADSHDQAAAVSSEPHLAVEFAVASAGPEETLQDLPEESVTHEPVAASVPTPADVPVPADQVEPRQVPEQVLPFEEPVTEESTEEHGNAPSTFGSDPSQVPHEEAALRQDPAGSPAAGGTYDLELVLLQPMPACFTAPDGACLLTSRLRPEAQRCHPVSEGTDLDGNSSQVSRGGDMHTSVQPMLRSRALSTRIDYRHGSRSGKLRNARSRLRNFRFTGLDRNPGPRSRVCARRGVCRLPRGMRNFQPRSPPAQF